MNLGDFQLHTHEKVELTPGFEVVVASAAPLEIAAAGLERLYEEFMGRFSTALTYYVTGTMTSWKKPNDKVLRMVPSWLSEPKNLASGDLLITLHSGPTEVELMPPSLQMNLENGRSFASVLLPPDFVTGGPETALAFVQSAVGTWDALSAGWAGLALAFNEAMGPPSDDAKTMMRTWLKRHPGLGHGYNFAIHLRALNGIPNVNWLTLLGPELTARKGGLAAIETALASRSPEIKVHPLGNGVCIQAGRMPQIGDVNRGDDVPLYRAVGRYLKDIRTAEPSWVKLWGLQDDTEKWFARFDD